MPSTTLPPEVEAFMRAVEAVDFSTQPDDGLTRVLQEMSRNIARIRAASRGPNTPKGAPIVTGRPKLRLVSDDRKAA